jgi:hypothetical protein
MQELSVDLCSKRELELLLESQNDGEWLNRGNRGRTDGGM